MEQHSKLTYLLFFIDWDILFLFISHLLFIYFCSKKLCIFIYSTCILIIGKFCKCVFLLGIILLNTIHKLHAWAFSILSKLTIYQYWKFSIFLLIFIIFIKENMCKFFWTASPFEEHLSWKLFCHCIICFLNNHRATYVIIPLNF